MKIPVVLLDSTDLVPVFGHAGDAGADLHASDDCRIEPGERALVPTGIRLAIPTGYAGFVLPRSGLAVQTGLTVLNSPGLIDSGYRGEVKVILINHGDEAATIASGDRIAQLVVMGVESPRYVVVEEMDATERGEGGFGSTGVKGD